MESKSHALAAGAFVLVVLGMLIALAAWLLSDDADTVEYEMATRDAVTGLQEQASVRYKGVNVGKVTNITFSQEGEVLVRLAISPETPVTKSTYATLNLQGVTGLSFVQLSDHEEDRTPLAAGPNGVPRIPLHPGLLSIMGDRAEAFTEKASLAIDRISKLLDDGCGRQINLLCACDGNHWSDVIDIITSRVAHDEHQLGVLVGIKGAVIVLIHKAQFLNFNTSIRAISVVLTIIITAILIVVVRRAVIAVIGLRRSCSSADDSSDGHADHSAHVTATGAVGYTANC